MDNMDKNEARYEFAQFLESWWSGKGPFYGRGMGQMLDEQFARDRKRIDELEKRLSALERK